MLDGFYPSIATLIGAEPGEIAYVENATRAWDLAFYSLDFQPGDRILTCVSEYSSNYISYLQVAKKTGAEIVVVPDDRHGQIDLAALERAIVEAIDTFTPTEWANYFAAAGYDAT